MFEYQRLQRENKRRRLDDHGVYLRRNSQNQSTFPICLDMYGVLLVNYNPYLLNFYNSVSLGPQ